MCFHSSQKEMQPKLLLFLIEKIKNSFFKPFITSFYAQQITLLTHQFQGRDACSQFLDGHLIFSFHFSFVSFIFQVCHIEALHVYSLWCMHVLVGLTLLGVTVITNVKLIVMSLLTREGPNYTAWTIEQHSLANHLHDNVI
jgi:hypothetical protein